jgi:hypothetical protein
MSLEPDEQKKKAILERCKQLAYQCATADKKDTLFDSLEEVESLIAKTLQFYQTENTLPKDLELYEYLARKSIPKCVTIIIDRKFPDDSIRWRVNDFVREYIEFAIELTKIVLFEESMKLLQKLFDNETKCYYQDVDDVS